MIRTFLLCLLLAACASVDQVGSEPPKNPNYVKDACGYTWSYERKPVPENRWVIEQTNDIALHCGGAEKAESCAIRHSASWQHPEVCEIYLPNEPEDDTFCHSLGYLSRHEALHCLGWVHPGGLEW